MNSEGEMAKTRGKSVTAGTEKKLRNLVPFKPGQSGNPKGRPKGARADITDLRLHLDWQDGGGDQG